MLILQTIKKLSNRVTQGKNLVTKIPNQIKSSLIIIENLIRKIFHQKKIEIEKTFETDNQEKIIKIVEVEDLKIINMEIKREIIAPKTHRNNLKKEIINFGKKIEMINIKTDIKIGEKNLEIITEKNTNHKGSSENQKIILMKK